MRDLCSEVGKPVIFRCKTSSLRGPKLWIDVARYKVRYNAKMSFSCASGRWLTYSRSNPPRSHPSLARFTFRFLHHVRAWNRLVVGGLSVSVSLRMYVGWRSYQRRQQRSSSSFFSPEPPRKRSFLVLKGIVNNFMNEGKDNRVVMFTRKRCEAIAFLSALQPTSASRSNSSSYVPFIIRPLAPFPDRGAGERDWTPAWVRRRMTFQKYSKFYFLFWGSFPRSCPCFILLLLLLSPLFPVVFLQLFYFVDFVHFRVVLSHICCFVNDIMLCYSHLQTSWVRIGARPQQLVGNYLV